MINKSNKTILSISLLCISLLFSLFLIEIILRYSFKKDNVYRNNTIQFIMQNLRRHEDAGYLWKEDIRIDIDNVPQWYDQEKFPLITDEIGFFNPLLAIEMKKDKHINIIGLGDSFIYGASFAFFEFFSQKGLFYYNMAMHRHCPPQYNIVLEKYAIKQKPDLVIYGIYENDFDETIDFEQWKKSGLDWFSYHSDTWAGPPISLPSWRIMQRKYFPGISVLEQRIRRKLNLPVPIYRQTPSFTTEEEKTKKVFNYISHAHHLATSNNIAFLCVLIPARDVNSGGVTSRDNNYTMLSKMLLHNNIPALDLRPLFKMYPNRESLYYKADAHWNRLGMLEAAKQILWVIGEK